MLNGTAVGVFVESPEGIPLVLDVNKPQPHFWKLPGGKGEGNETPEESGCRECREETGVIIPMGSAEAIYEEPRKNHVFHLIHAKVTSLNGLKPVGDEGEIVKVFSKDEMRALENFFPSHKKILKECRLW